MNKLLIALAAAMVICGTAQAGEEIKLAAAIGSGAAVKPAPAAGTAGTASSAAATTATMATSNMVAIGVIAAAGLGAVANSGSSSSH